MGADARCWLAGRRGLTPVEFRVLAGLVDLAGGAGACWPGLRALAVRCGLSDTETRRALLSLGWRGEVASMRSRPSGGLIYVLNLRGLTGAEWGAAVESAVGLVAL